MLNILHTIPASKVWFWLSLGVIIVGGFFLSNANPIQASPECVDNNTPIPVIDKLNPTIGINETITLSAAVSHDPDGDPLNYLWSINYLGIQQSGETFTFNPPNKGYFTVTLVAGDPCGNWDVTWTTIEVDLPQHCALGNSTPVPVIEPQFSTAILGDTVNFNGSGSYDPDGDSLNFLWAVNQLGITHNQSTFEFTPPEAGQYVVTLVAGDQCGTWDVGFTVLNVEPDFNEPKPDLNISQLEYAIFNEGSETEPQVPAVYVMPCNYSGIDITEPTEVELNIGDNNTRTIRIPALADGECYPVPTFLHELDPLLPAPGDYQVMATVDPGNLIAESDETNNTVSELMHFSLVDKVEPPAEDSKLLLDADLASPQSDGLLIGGSSQITVAELLLSAINGDVDLSSLLLNAWQVNGGDLNKNIDRVYLFDGSTEIASLTPTNTYAVTFQDLDGKFIVPKNSSKRLTVKVDTAEISNQRVDGKTAISGSGQQFTINEDGYGAKDAVTGIPLNQSNTSGHFLGKKFTLHKSLPSLSRQPLATNTIFDGSGIPVFRFKLTADPKGDIGLYKNSYIIATSGASLNQLELFENPGTSSEVNLTTDAVRSPVAYTSNSWLLDLLFDVSNDGRGDIRTISAGTYKTFELRGSISGSNTGDSISVALLGDATRGLSNPTIATTANSYEQNDFIWSDLYYGAATSGSVNIAEWFNGYSVPGLSSTSSFETLTR